MKDFLKKLKLVDNLTTDLEIGRTEFVEKLKARTAAGDTGMFAPTFETYSASKSELVGQVNLEGFTLKRRMQSAELNPIVAVARGKIVERNGRLTIESEINGFKSFFIVYYIFIIIVYSIFIFSISTSASNTRNREMLFLLLHGTCMFSIPYFVMRFNVKQLKKELEREFLCFTTCLKSK